MKKCSALVAAAAISMATGFIATGATAKNRFVPYATVGTWNVVAVFGPGGQFKACRASTGYSNGAIRLQLYHYASGSNMLWFYYNKWKGRQGPILVLARTRVMNLLVNNREVRRRILLLSYSTQIGAGKVGVTFKKGDLSKFGKSAARMTVTGRDSANMDLTVSLKLGGHAKAIRSNQNCFTANRGKKVN